jgi:dihydroxy-acid dehydratase
MKPTTMLYRNLMAMDVEENIRSYPLDAVVLLAGCDKTVPAELMGAISVDVPAIMVTGGPAGPARFRGREVAVGSDLWRFAQDVRSGRMPEAEFAEFEAAANPSVGHCNELGTASPWPLVEALGMTARGCRDPGGRRTALRRGPPGARGPSSSGGAPAVCTSHDRGVRQRRRRARRSRPTNAIIHLIAMAGRAGGSPLERFVELAARTPLLVNPGRPASTFRAALPRGGIQTLMAEPRCSTRMLQPTARTIAENVRGARARPRVARLGRSRILSGHPARWLFCAAAWRPPGPC